MNYEDEYLSFDIRRDSVHEDSGEEEIDSATIKSTDRENLESLKNVPFELHWIFGHDPKIPIINLTKTADSFEMGYGASQIGTVYNHNWKRCSFLLGHKYQLNSFKCECTGRFLMTADQKCINFWDREGCTHSNDPIHIHSIENVYDKSNVIACGLSNDGKFLVSLNNTNLLKFWMWSFGRLECDDELQIPQTFGPVKSIKFSKNKNENEWFVVTYSSNVVFGWWDYEKDSLVVHYPNSEHHLKHINDSTYIENSERCVSVTENGQAILWSNCALESKSLVITNIKNVYKIIPIQNVTINVVESIDNVVVFGDGNGEIRFYDKDIKFLYWFQSIKFDPIVSISFNLTPRNFFIEDQKIFSARSEEEAVEIIFSDTLSLDATPNHNVFLVRNFIVGTSTGKIGLVDFVKKKCEYVLYKSENEITSFYVHPMKPWICVGNQNGRLLIYNYETKKNITEYKLPYQKIKENGKWVWINPGVTYISYSKSGDMLCCGLDNGSIFVLDPIILNPIQRQALKFTSSPIEHIKTSEKCNYIAYTDRENCLCFIEQLNQTEWTILDKYRHQKRKILDLIWTQNNGIDQLIVIRDDKAIAIYDIQKETIDSPTQIKQKIIKLEQSAKIKSATLVPSQSMLNVKTDSNILITTTNQYKFKLFDGSTFDHLKTFSAPLYDQPISSTKLFSSTKSGKFLIFSTEKSIGLQMLPIDGDPLKRIGMIVSPCKIKTIMLSGDQKFIFTLSENSNSVFMWIINSEIVKINYEQRSLGIESFYNYIPGGKSGWLFKEIRSIFHYFQMLARGTNASNESNENFPITEIPDFMRGLGYFPSEFEITNMMNEVKNDLPDDSELKEISFDCLFKLYINYRPVAGLQVMDMYNAFKQFRNQHTSRFFNESSETTVIEQQIDEDMFITKAELLKLLTEKGEKIDDHQAILYLKELLLREEDVNLLDAEKKLTKNDDIFNALPFKISVKNLIDRLLGISNDAKLTVDEKNEENHPVFGSYSYIN